MNTKRFREFCQEDRFGAQSQSSIKDGEFQSAKRHAGDSTELSGEVDFGPVTAFGNPQGNIFNYGAGGEAAEIDVGGDFVLDGNDGMTVDVQTESHGNPFAPPMTIESGSHLNNRRNHSQPATILMALNARREQNEEDVGAWDALPRRIRRERGRGGFIDDLLANDSMMTTSEMDDFDI
jgi:hypothetical protein